MRTKCLLLAAALCAAAVTMLAQAAPGRERTARDLSTPFEATTRAAKTDPEAAPEHGQARGRRVLDENERPVAGARITIYAARWKARSAEAVETVVTDALGRFEFSEGDAHVLVVSADGYPPTPFMAVNETEDLCLGPGLERTVTVVDGERNPIAGAEVDVYADWDHLLLLATARADARGQATLWLSGRESLLVRFPGFGYEGAGSDPVVLRRGYSIGGKVADSAGRPIAGARVVAHQGGG